MKNTFFLFLLLGIVGCYDQTPDNTGLEGKPLPEFSLLLQDSTTYFNTKNIPANKPVVLILFSPECPYCRAQIREITEDINKLKDVQFFFVTKIPPSYLRQFSNEFKLDKYPNIIAGIDTSNFMSEYFKPTGVPYTAIYGNDKKLNNAFEGRIFVKQIKSVLEE